MKKIRLANLEYPALALCLILSSYYFSIVFNIPIVCVEKRATYIVPLGTLANLELNNIIILANTIIVALLTVATRNKLTALALIMYAVTLNIFLNNILYVFTATIILNMTIFAIKLFEKQDLHFKKLIKYLAMELFAVECITIIFIICSKIAGVDDKIFFLLDRSIYAPAILVLPYITILLFLKWIPDIIQVFRKKCWNIEQQFSKTSITPLIISIIIAELLIASPYIIYAGQPIKPISTDSAVYAYTVKLVEEKGFWNIITQTLKSRRFLIISGGWGVQRPLHIAILYAIYKLTGIDLIILADYVHHIIFINLIIILIWLLARNFFGDNIAGVAALLTASSPIIAGFRTGGFQANEANLALALLYYSLLLNPNTYAKIIVTIMLGVIMPFIHPWSAALYLVSAIPYIIILHVIKYNKRSLLKRTIIIILTIIIPLTIIAYLIGLSKLQYLYGTIILRALPLKLENLTLSEITDSLTKTIYHYCWSSLCNPLTYIPALLACYDPLSLSLTLTSSIPAILTIGRPTTYFRLILIIPLTITAALVYTKLPKETIYLAATYGILTNLYIILNVTIIG